MTVGDMDHPVSVEAFTIPRAAEALGRSHGTIRRWIAADKIPAPYLVDAATDHRVYSVGEMETIAGVLRVHEREFDYLSDANRHAIETLRQAVSAYRAEFI